MKRSFLYDYHIVLLLCIFHAFRCEKSVTGRSFVQSRHSYARLTRGIDEMPHTHTHTRARLDRSREDNAENAAGTARRRLMSDGITLTQLTLNLHGRIIFNVRCNSRKFSLGENFVKIHFDCERALAHSLNLLCLMGRAPPRAL